MTGPLRYRLIAAEIRNDCPDRCSLVLPETGSAAGTRPKAILAEMPNIRSKSRLVDQPFRLLGQRRPLIID